MKRSHAALLLASILLLIAEAGLTPIGGRVRIFPGRRLVIEGAPEQRFVSLRISPLAQVEYADGKDLWFRTTYRGPVELVARTERGVLLRRRSFGVEISGYGKRDPVTIRLR